MTIKILYDPVEDRMRFVLQPPDQSPVVYWVKRNQWLVLLARLRAAAARLGIELSEPEPLKVPRMRPPRNPELEALPAKPVDAIRIRMESDGIRLQIQYDGHVRGLLLKAPGIKQFEELVAMQAERAGWDPAAGIRRIQAAALARQALRQSSQKS